MGKGHILRNMLALLTLALAPVAPGFAADERQSLEELRNTVINLLQVLVDQGVLSRDKAEQMVKAAQEKAAASAAALAKSEEGAVRVPYVPQIVRDEIAKQVAEEVRPTVVADVVHEARDEKWGVPGALPEWLTRTRVSGSVLIREEDILFARGNQPNTVLNYYAINTAGGIGKLANPFENLTEDRARFRGKARLGVESDLSDSLTAGVRVVTGNTSDLVSETQTVDGTAPYQFGLDELFLRYDGHTTDHFTWLSAVGGRFLNPYGTPTDLVFNKDLTFTGAAVTGKLGIGDGSAEQSHLFMTLGAHQLQEIALSGHDKWLLGAQLGANLRWGDGQQLRLTGGFFDYLNVTGIRNAFGTTTYNYTAPTFLRQGNTYFDIANQPDTSVNLFALAARYRLADVNAVYTVPVGRYTFSVTADAVRNLGYDWRSVAAVANFIPRTTSATPVTVARTLGYQAELAFGTPTVLAAGEWRGVFGYRYLQRDAVIDAYTDSDFHFGGTDATGYYLVGDLGLANRLWLRFRYLSSNTIDGPAAGIDTVQIDLNTRF